MTAPEERFLTSRFWNEPWMRGVVHLLAMDGRAHLVGLPDPLHHGPVALDTDEHLARRAAHWRSLYRIWGAPFRRRGIGALERAIESDAPLVVWQSQSWQSVLAAAWMSHVLRERGVPARRVAHATLPWMRTARGERLCVQPWFWWSCCHPYGDRPVDPRVLATRVTVARAFDQRAPASARELASRAARWAAFAAPEPAALARLLLRDARLAQLGRAHLDKFPRARGRVLRLSTVDHWLLGPLDERTPRSFVDLVRHHRCPGPVHAEWGDGELLGRLHAWAEGPFVEREDDPTGKSPFTRHRFRLTGRGARLMRRAIDDLAELPPLTTGGHTIGRDPLWVVRGGRLERG